MYSWLGFSQDKLNDVSNSNFEKNKILAKIQTTNKNRKKKNE